MRRSNHTDDEIMSLLREAEAGVPIPVICQSAHISVRTFYRWRRQFGGMPPAAVRRLRTLERENQDLRRLVARLKESNPGGAWGGWLDGSGPPAGRDQAPRSALTPTGEGEAAQRAGARNRSAIAGGSRHRGTGASAGPFASLRAGRS